MRTLNSFLLLCLLVISGVFVATEWVAKPGHLTVAFLDVGQGDSIYIEAPNGFQVLIDGGAGGAVMSELGSVMPWFDHSIDIVMVTHPDQDHIGGLFDVIQYYQIGMVVDTGFPILDELDALWYDLVLERDVGHQPVRAGQRIVLDAEEQVFLDILHPIESVDIYDNVNDGSVIARLQYGEQSFLFTGDASQLVEQDLLFAGSYLQSSVLKIGHHGSRTSSNELFLNAVSPGLAIIQAGADNRYGHPHTDVIERLQFLGIPYLCTCNAGRIVFTSDGETLYKK